MKSPGSILALSFRCGADAAAAARCLAGRIKWNSGSITWSFIVPPASIPEIQLIYAFCQTMLVNFMLPAKHAVRCQVNRLAGSIKFYACQACFVLPVKHAGRCGADAGVAARCLAGRPRKVDIRLPGKGNSNSRGARPVYLFR